MTPHPQQRLIPLAEAAEVTQRPEDDLRRACATGRLRCERIGERWYLLEDDLHAAATLGEVRPTATRSVLSIAFPDERNGRRAYEQLRRRYGLGADDLGLARLALDGADLVLVAGVFPPEAIEDVVELVRSLRGVIVEGTEVTRLGRSAGRRPREDQGQSSYG